MTSLSFKRHGDKQNSEFFEHYLQELLTERDRVGLTDMIGQIEALMITVDPKQFIRYVCELCLMTPYQYLVTLECESHWTHILRIDGMLTPIDYLATRVYSQNRETAIFERLSLSSYYYWGSYDIKDQNSSTNVTKSVHFEDEIYSPAKVFTANNTPYFVNHLERLSSPTETFVRNYGPRLHHLAIGVNDGEYKGMENIEQIVDAITKQGKKFLLDVIGPREEGIKQIFSGASEHFTLIIEYVQRYGDFDGFFTKQNMAELTHAAGADVELLEMQSVAMSTTPPSFEHH